MRKLAKKILNFNPIYWVEIYKLFRAINSFEHLSSEKRKGIALVWFSYSKDFEILSSSIKSANIFTDEQISQLIIIQDRSSPFTFEQISCLKSISNIPLAIRTSKYPLNWAGVATIASEIEAFYAIFQKYRIEWLVKIDSDALAISNKIFKLLHKQPNIPLLIGQSSKLLYRNNHTLKKTDWAQGGCYSFNFHAFNSIKKASLPLAVFKTLHSTNLPLKYLPEDVFFTLFLQSANVSVKFYRFHYPIWFRKDLFSPNEFLDTQNYYSILHFEGCKKHQIKTLDEIKHIAPEKIEHHLTLKWNTN